jgi:hypothetical protein
MATSFSVGRRRSTQREPPTMDKQLVNFITCGCVSSAPVFVIYKAGREYFWISWMLSLSFLMLLTEIWQYECYQWTSWMLSLNFLMLSPDFPMNVFVIHSNLGEMLFLKRLLNPWVKMSGYGFSTNWREIWLYLRHNMNICDHTQKLTIAL